MATELKPCPFCGCEAVTTTSILDEHYVICTNCTCAGPGGWSEQEAIEAWNRRAEDADLHLSY